MEFVDHDLEPDRVFTEIGYEEKRVLDHAGNPVEGLHAVWITLDNPEQSTPTPPRPSKR